MAKETKKDPTELSIEEKLKNLYQLQMLLSEIDKIETLRGELPLEVQDLEDEIAGLTTRVDNIHTEIDKLNADIATAVQPLKPARPMWRNTASSWTMCATTASMNH